MHVRALNTIVFFALLAVVTWGAYLLFAPFARAIFVAAVLAILFAPLHRWCAAHIPSAGLAALLSVLIVLLLITVPLVVLVAVVVSQVAATLQTLPLDATLIIAARDHLATTVAHLPFGRHLSALLPSSAAIHDLLQRSGGIALTIAQKTYAGLLGGLLGLFVLFFTLYYFFKDGARFLKLLMFLSPLSDAHEQHLFHRFSAMSRATIKGTIVIGLVQSALGAGIIALAGLSHVAVLWATMFFFAIIPFLGVGVIGFPAALFLFITGHTGTAVLTAIGFAAIALLDNYLRPLLVGHGAAMHPLLVFFATIGGLMTFGGLGFLVGPVIMALFVTFWEIYRAEFAQQLRAYNRATAQATECSDA